MPKRKNNKISGKSILLYPFLWMLSLAPFPLLYLFSDLAYFIIYKIVGYRKAVVRKNLERSFPNKTEKEIIEIEKKYYRFLSDLIFETFKGLTISKKQLSKRVTIKNPEVFQKFYDKGQNVSVVLGHYGNWEWVCLASEFIAPHSFWILYKPLSDDFFERYMYGIRSRFGALPVAINTILRKIIEENPVSTAFVFVGDQNPPSPYGAHWMNFLNQETAVMTGMEKISTRFELPVIYASINKYKRGYYSIECKVLVEEPGQIPANTLTELQMKELESNINKNPAYWLWSHRRWKHKRPV